MLGLDGGQGPEGVRLMQPSKLSYSYKEAVAATGATRSMLSGMVASGELQVVRRGRRVFICAESLAAAFGWKQAA